MIKRTRELITVSIIFYYMAILGIMVYVYQNPSSIKEVGLTEGFKNMNITINILLMFIINMASFMLSVSHPIQYSYISTFLYIIYQVISCFFTNYYIQKVAQSGKDLFYFVIAPIMLSLAYFFFIEIVSRVLYGKYKYEEVKILDKKASWKQFKKDGVSGFITTNIFADVRSVNGYIEACCSNITFPDYCYKRFSLDKEGYESAYNWITKKGRYMQMSRNLTIDDNGNIKSLFPQTHEWNQENSKNEPFIFKIETNLEDLKSKHILREDD